MVSQTTVNVQQYAQVDIVLTAGSRYFIRFWAASQAGKSSVETANGYDILVPNKQQLGILL
jgi:hypothetical protein